MNFRTYNDNPIRDGSNGKPPPPNVALMRQSSIYSLTFDEFQNTMPGNGKDFGSMNMDELLKNIWTAEETQPCNVGGENNHNINASGNLQKQGSLTLPRTLSQKTVDEVWRDLIKDNGSSMSTVPQTRRQQTLGEMTLEEFLVRAGVVRENLPQQVGRPNGNNAWLGELSRANNNAGLVFGFQQPNRNNGNPGSNNSVSKQQPPPLFPKPANAGFAPSMHMLNNAPLSSPGSRAGITNGGLVQSSAFAGVSMVGLANSNVTAAAVSPASQISPEVISKTSIDTCSLSPVPYVINGGRKCGAVEKVVERRQRRMIKNRESAARSRARKQAYTLELEAEVEKLKEINRELQRKQEEIMEVQKNQALERMKWPWGANKRCLRRTLTGPW